MLTFNLSKFVNAYGQLAYLEGLALGIRSDAARRFLTNEEKDGVIKGLNEISSACQSLLLLTAIPQLGRIKNILNRRSCEVLELTALLKDLKNRIDDGLRDKVCIVLMEADVNHYSKPELLGRRVVEKFGGAVSDVEEAGNCLALGRGTACVFHLMRVMEVGVQTFGKKLHVALTGEKTWQRILDELNKPIRNMPTRTKPQTSRKEEFAALHAQLYNVKLVWRNNVMHPKASYSPEEAGDIFKHVDIFMRHLARLL